MYGMDFSQQSGVTQAPRMKMIVLYTLRLPRTDDFGNAQLLFSGFLAHLSSRCTGAGQGES